LPSKDKTDGNMLRWGVHRVAPTDNECAFLNRSSCRWLRSE
jgi:hypothetical protein